MLKNISKNRYLMILLSFLIACGLATILPGSGDMALYDSVIRIHVVANSDSPHDQALKYKVRDEIVAVSNILLQNCHDITQARDIIGANLAILEKTARDTSAKNGFGYGAKLSFEEEFYPTRNYGSLRLPAGKYRSLKIELGNGGGKNWWCIIYPTFCLNPSLDTHASQLIDTDAPVNYKIKFKLLEFFQSAH